MWVYMRVVVSCRAAFCRADRRAAQARIIGRVTLTESTEYVDVESHRDHEHLHLIATDGPKGWDSYVSKRKKPTDMNQCDYACATDDDTP